MFFKNKKINKGFTIMELMVVMFVSTLILASLVIQNNKWNDRLTVSAQAYELSLMVRQAQMYSLGVREDVGGSGDKFNVGYGVFVDMATPTQYIFFVDRDGDFRYDAGESVETKLFTRGVSLLKICSTTVNFSLKSCSDTFLGSLVIHKYHGSFKRPDTSTRVSFFNVAYSNMTALFRPRVEIYLRSQGGKQSVVKVEANGQVSVDDL